MSQTLALRTIAAGIRADVPVLVWGNPGVAKTATLTALGKTCGFHTEVIVGGNREATDFIGLPYEDDGTTGYLGLGWAERLRRSEKGLLIIDELTTAAPSVQKAMLRVLQERMVGDTPLPDHVRVIAIANPPETAADGWDLPAPVANRFMHVDWQFDAESWFLGMSAGFDNLDIPTLDDILGPENPSAAARAKGAITAFARANRHLLNPNPPSDAAEAGRAWPSPRSWHNAAEALAAAKPGDEDVAHLIVKGCAGEAAAIEFQAWLATADLHDPAEVMADPAIVRWRSERPDRLFALCSSVTALVASSGTTADWKAGCRVFAACAEGGKPDVATPFIQQMHAMKPEGANFDAEVLRAFADLYRRMGAIA